MLAAPVGRGPWRDLLSRFIITGWKPIVKMPGGLFSGQVGDFRRLSGWRSAAGLGYLVVPKRWPWSGSCSRAWGDAGARRRFGAGFRSGGWSRASMCSHNLAAGRRRRKARAARQAVAALSDRMLRTRSVAYCPPANMMMPAGVSSRAPDWVQTSTGRVFLFWGGGCPWVIGGGGVRVQSGLWSGC